VPICPLCPRTPVHYLPGRYKSNARGFCCEEIAGGDQASCRHAARNQIAVPKVDRIAERCGTDQRPEHGTRVVQARHCRQIRAGEMVGDYSRAQRNGRAVSRRHRRTQKGPGLRTPPWLARSKRWAREYWTSRPATKSMAAPAHPTDCRSSINSNSPPTFWLSSRAEPGNQHRRIFDAVARTASSLKRDRRFADSPLEGDGFELPVPEREDRVSSLGLLLARDRGVGADVSVQPGFVIIMPSPLEASGAPLCCSPVDPEDDERDQVPTIRAICRTEGYKYLEWTRAPRSR
jgi:hypothetical protein